MQTQQPGVPHVPVFNVPSSVLIALAAIVLVHGSGRDAATQYMYTGDHLPAHGIATLTYDKRGTGASTGEYTFDFELLARDVVAAGVA